MGLIQSEFDNLGVMDSDYTTFVQAIPFQIYAILAIIMIPLVAFTKLDFSQMKKAELRAGKSNEMFSFMQEDEEKGSAETGYSRKNAKPVMVVLPILVVFVTLFGTLARPVSV